MKPERVLVGILVVFTACIVFILTRDAWVHLKSTQEESRNTYTVVVTSTKLYTGGISETTSTEQSMPETELVVTSSLKPSLITSTSTGFIDLTPITAGNIFILVNQERTNRGLKPLTRSKALDQAASMKAQDEADKNYFAHISPAGLDSWHWFKEAGYNFVLAGENLARNYDYNPGAEDAYRTSQDIVKAWMASESHKSNILNPRYLESGVAVFGKYEVQMFGTPKQ